MWRGETEGGEHQEEIALRDAQFDMLASGMLRPFLRRRNLRFLKNVAEFLPPEETALIDESAEIGRLGYVRRRGDDAVGERLAGLCKIEHHPAKRRLGRLFRTFRNWQARGHGQV